jgi:hypothetical protein
MTRAWAETMIVSICSIKSKINILRASLALDLTFCRQRVTIPCNIISRDYVSQLKSHQYRRARISGREMLRTQYLYAFIRRLSNILNEST